MNPELSLLPSARALTLADLATVEVVIDGTAPLTVVPPQPLLDRTTSKFWKIVPQGSPLLTRSKPGQERWVQVYQVEPFKTADAEQPLGLQFQDFSVRSGSNLEGQLLPCPRLDFTVTTTVRSDALPRPLAEREPLPPLPIPVESSSAILWVLPLLGTAIFGVVIFGFVRRRQREQRRQQEQIRQRLIRNQTILSEPAEAPVAELILQNLRALLQRRGVADAHSQTSRELQSQGALPESWVDVWQACEATLYAGSPLPQSVRTTAVQILADEEFPRS